MEQFIEIECIDGKRKKYNYIHFMPVSCVIWVSTMPGDYILYYKGCNGCGWSNEDEIYYSAEYCHITENTYKKIKDILEIKTLQNQKPRNHD